MNMINKFKEYLRVARITRKPERDEVMSTLRICLIGLGIIGLLGFIFYLISTTLLGGL